MLGHKRGSETQSRRKKRRVIVDVVVIVIIDVVVVIVIIDVIVSVSLKAPFKRKITTASALSVGRKI